MAPKKATARVSKKKKAVEVVPEAVETEQAPSLMMTEVEVLKLSKLQLQLQLAEARRIILAKEKAEYLAKIDPEDRLKQFDEAIHNNVVGANDVLADYHLHIKTVGDRLGVDMSKCGFDEATGQLVALE